MVAPFIRYSLLRFGILIVVFGLLYLAGAGGWLLLLLTAVISAALGYLLLGRQRDAVTADLIEKRKGNLAKRIDADNDAEDADHHADDDALNKK